MIVSCANLYSLMARKDIYTTWITSPLILLNLLLLLLFRGVCAVCVCVVCTLCKCNVKWKLQKLISTWNDWNKKKIKERRLWTSLFELHGFGYVSSECVPLKRSVAEHRPYWVAAHWWTIAAVLGSTPYAHTSTLYMLSGEEVIGGHRIKELSREWWKTLMCM